MGARESRSQQEADDDGTTPQDDDYYTILEVDENASADEIRVSFSPIRTDQKKKGDPFLVIIIFLRRNIL
jgi:hypothetical protein